jgi:hypothetical protein
VLERVVKVEMTFFIAIERGLGCPGRVGDIGGAYSMLRF